MPRQRNPVGIAAGKLILALQTESSQIADAAEAAHARKVIYRARTLLQASQSSSVLLLLNGRSVTEYLDSDWVQRHPAVIPDIDAFTRSITTDSMA